MSPLGYGRNLNFRTRKIWVLSELFAILGCGTISRPVQSKFGTVISFDLVHAFKQSVSYASI